MSATIVYETHSTTVDNENNVSTGWLPGELSAQGRLQATQLGARRGDDGVDAVIASDLARAVETARIAFGDGGPPVAADSRLRECDYGDWNGTGKPLRAGRLDFLDRPYPGGESYTQAVARTGELLDEIAAGRHGCRVLLIGHRVTFFALEHLWNGRSLAEVVTAQFEWRPGWTYLSPRRQQPQAAGWAAPTRQGRSARG
ncbi:MAG: histidine phosphatase family protein [Stackebrandtia sp.]